MSIRFHVEYLKILHYKRLIIDIVDNSSVHRITQRRMGGVPSEKRGIMSSDSHTSLTKQAYEILKERIMRLQLRPGELIMVQPLSRELGYSRTPVREALIRLESDGFVEEADGKKFRVSELTLTDIMEIHQIREMIELHAVRTVAETRTQEWLDILSQYTASMRVSAESRDHVPFFQMDMAFHRQLIVYCGNRTLESLVAQLNEKIQRIRHLTTFVYHRLEDTLEEHDAILASIGEQDPDGAARAMKYHLDQVKDGVVKLFEDGTIDFFGGASFS